MLRHKRILVVVRLVFFLMIASMAIPGFVKGTLSPVLPILLVVYLVTNLAMLFERSQTFFSQRAQAVLLLFDIFVLAVSLAYLQGSIQELFLAMFLVVLLASAGQKLSVSIGGFVAVAAFYTWFSLRGAEGDEDRMGLLLTGLPVLLVVAIYVGYVTEAVARERRRRVESEDRLHKELQGMNRVQSLVSSLSLELDPDRLFQGVADTARALLDVPSAAVFWGAKGETRFRGARTDGFPAALAELGERPAGGASPLLRALSGTDVLRLAPGAEGACPEWAGRVRELGLDEVLFAPFADRVAGHQGCLVVAWPAPHEHLRVEEEALQVLVQQAGICIENSALYRLLGQTRDVWQAAFQSIPTPVVIVDGESRIVQANPAFLALAELDLATLVGSSFGDVLRGASHPGGRPVAGEELGAALNGPARLTIPRLRGDFDVTKGPYVGAAGSGAGTVWVLRKLSADVVTG